MSVPTAFSAVDHAAADQIDDKITPGRKLRRVCAIDVKDLITHRLGDVAIRDARKARIDEPVMHANKAKGAFDVSAVPIKIDGLQSVKSRFIVRQRFTF